MLRIEEHEGAHESVDQYFGIAIRRVRAGQEIGADHLEAIAARFIRAQHQGCGFDRLLHDGKLALEKFEVDEVERLGSAASCHSCLRLAIAIELARESIPIANGFGRKVIDELAHLLSVHLA